LVGGERFGNVLQLRIHDGANTWATRKKEFADPNLSCIGFVVYQYGIFIEEGKTWNTLIDGVGGGFSVVLAIRNIVIP
jgi:hypothetical protein